MTPVIFRDVRKEITDTLENTHKSVFTWRDLESLFKDNEEEWGLPRSTPASDFVEYLISSRLILRHELKFPSRVERRYTRGGVEPLELFQSLRPKGYFTHFTALYLNDLTTQLPKAVYLNTEQRNEGGQGREDMTQDRIDWAFTRNCRETRTAADYKGNRIYLLNGRNTGLLGVIDIDLGNDRKIRTTDIERTLIDITVRPVYAGGVGEVLSAYEAAAMRVSINRLCAFLKKLDYVYPYHQAIGFYMEKTGAYSERQLSLLERFATNYDFYLTHQIGDKEYSKRWRLYYPRGL